jgi:hypothetical protein
MVLDPTGEVGHAIELHDCVAKKNSGRRIPVNPALRIALTAWCLLTGDAGRVIRSERGDALSPICMRTRSAIPRTVSAQHGLALATPHDNNHGGFSREGLGWTFYSAEDARTPEEVTSNTK